MVHAIMLISIICIEVLHKKRNQFSIVVSIQIVMIISIDLKKNENIILIYFQMVNGIRWVYYCCWRMTIFPFSISFARLSRILIIK